MVTAVQPQENVVLAFALGYEALGLSVIPLRLDHYPDECRADHDEHGAHQCPQQTERGSKKPALAWDQYAKRRASVEEITAWWTEFPEAGIGIVCGTVSAPPGKTLVALDFDDTLGFERLLGGPDGVIARQTFVQKTRRGYHVLVYADAPVPKGKIKEYSLDVQAERSYIVAQPSVHPMTGERYEWLRTANTIIDVGDFDAFLKRVGYRPPRQEESFADAGALHVTDLLGPVDVGNRHNFAVKVAGLLAASNLSSNVQLAFLHGMVESNFTNADGGAPDLRELELMLASFKEKESRKASLKNPSLGDLITDGETDLDEMFLSPLQTMGLSTGFSKVDRSIGGLERSTLIILAGRPGNYKTDFALEIARNVAQARKGVAMFSLEMKWRKVVARLIQKATGVTIHELRKRPGGKMTALEYDRYKRAKADLAHMPLFVNDDSSLTPKDIEAHLVAMNRRFPIELVIVDYANLMRPDEPQFSRERELAHVITRLADISKVYDIPVMLLAQLNRNAGTRRDDADPTLADLRESDMFGIRGDVVMFTRAIPAQEGELYEPERLRVIIGKQKDGPTHHAIPFIIAPDGRRLLEDDEGV